jgi:hypothetical protein
MSALTLARLQGTANLMGGLWPLLHLKSFEAVFGPKTDRWLVKTVSGLLVVNGLTQLGPRSVPATFEAGTAGSKLHTRRRILARVFSTRRNAAGVTSSRLRHTVGRDATAPSRLLAQGVDVGDRLTARGQHRRDIHPDLPAAMNGEEVALAQRRRQPVGEPDPVGQ